MKSFYVGVKGIILNDDKVLLLQRSKSERQDRFWDAPGGRMQDTESFEEALTRELAEEIGNIKGITVTDLLHVYRLPKNVEHEHGLILVFFRVHATISDVILSEEHDAYRWVSRDELASFFDTEALYINDGVKQAVQLALNQI